MLRPPATCRPLKPSRLAAFRVPVSPHFALLGTTTCSRTGYCKFSWVPSTRMFWASGVAYAAFKIMDTQLDSNSPGRKQGACSGLWLHSWRSRGSQVWEATGAAGEGRRQKRSQTSQMEESLHLSSSNQPPSNKVRHLDFPSLPAMPAAFVLGRNVWTETMHHKQQLISM